MDVLIDENGDLDVSGGDVSVGNSKRQSQRLLILSDKNEWKENPVFGVGINRFLEDEEEADMFREIREQFRMDGQPVKKLALLPGGKIGIES